MITELRGVNFRPAEAKNIVKTMDETNTLTLERDPENAYDRFAIRVIDFESGEFLGFVAKEDAETLAPQMDDGTQFSVAYHTRSGPGSVMLEIAEVDDGEDDDE